MAVCQHKYYVTHFSCCKVISKLLRSEPWHVSLLTCWPKHSALGTYCVAFPHPSGGVADEHRCQEDMNVKRTQSMDIKKSMDIKRTWISRRAWISRGYGYQEEYGYQEDTDIKKTWISVSENRESLLYQHKSIPTLMIIELIVQIPTHVLAIDNIMSFYSANIYLSSLDTRIFKGQRSLFVVSGSELCSRFPWLCKEWLQFMGGHSFIPTHHHTKMLQPEN